MTMAHVDYHSARDELREAAREYAATTNGADREVAWEALRKAALMYAFEATQISAHDK